MNDAEEDRYEIFMNLHAQELREKSLAAVGSSCIVCDEALSLSSDVPWLECKNNHKIRPWTETEIDAMEKRDAL